MSHCIVCLIYYIQAKAHSHSKSPPEPSEPGMDFWSWAKTTFISRLDYSGGVTLPGFGQDLAGVCPGLDQSLDGSWTGIGARNGRE